MKTTAPTEKAKAFCRKICLTPLPLHEIVFQEQAEMGSLVEISLIALN
tara:strand:+ start:426 stop:569 length:144 start_codon:yes stop_codon:yes gene_type:complete